MVQRRLRTTTARALQPPEFLCDLVDGQAQAQLDEAAYAELNAALISDSFTGEEYSVLPLIAALAAEHHPDDPFTARIQGVRRRNLVAVRSLESLVEVVRAHCEEGFLMGDLAAAHCFYRNPGDRAVTDSVWVVPSLTRAQAWDLALTVAAHSSAEVLKTRWPTLQHHGVRLALHRSLSTAFDFPRVRNVLDDSPECVLYASLVRSATGSPRVRWYSDAVHAGNTVDWDKVWWIAKEAGWSEPVGKAAALVSARLRDVPLRQASDSLVDTWYFRQSPALRRTRLALRLAQHGGLPSALR